MIKASFEGSMHELLDGDPHGAHRAVRRLKVNLPTADTAAESLLLRLLLVVSLDRAARDMHRQYHAVFTRGACTLAPPLMSEREWMDPERAIDALLDRWSAHFVEWFEESHTVPPILAALRLLHQRVHAHPSTRDLADAAGCSPTTLVQQFRAMFGMTPAKYAGRLRVRDGMYRLRTSSVSVEEAARLAGYESPNKFYRRVKQYTSSRPSQIRGLSDEEFARILERRLSLRRADADRWPVWDELAFWLTQLIRKGQRAAG